MKTFIIQLVVFFCMYSQLFAQPQIACTPAPVKGRVVGPAGGPIEGAKVFVRNDPYCVDIEWKATQPESDDVIGEATTDANGEFRIEWKVREISAIENTSVNAELLVFAPSYAISFRSFSMWFPQNIEMKLRDEVEFQGTVLDEGGQPLADAEVLLECIYQDPSMINYMSSNSSVSCLFHSPIRPRVRTNQAGVFKLPGLGSKQIALVLVRHPKYRSMRSLQPVDESSPPTIEAGQPGNPFGEWHKYYGLPIRMPSEKRVVMTAVDSSTLEPLEGVEVCSFFSGSSTVTDKDGKFDYFPMPDEYAPSLHERLFFRRPDEDSWMASSRGRNRNDAAVAFVPRRRTIVGKVVDETTGQGIERVGVFIGRPESPGFTLTHTDRDGRYELASSFEGTDVSLHGPKSGYVLPVRKMSNAAEEAEGKVVREMHTKPARFKPHEERTEINFAVPRYPKVRVKVVDAAGKAVANTTVHLAPNRAAPLPASTSKSDEQGIVEFEIDRPVIRSSVWVANADGIGFVAINGMPDEVLTLQLEPAIAIQGQLSIEDRSGNIRDAADLMIYSDLNEPQEWSQISVGKSDGKGHYTVYLPKAEGEYALLYVRRPNDIPKQSWKVELVESKDVDFSITE